MTGGNRDPKGREGGGAPAEGRSAVAGGVSRETLARLDLIAQLLTRWQPTINLVAPATLPHLWTRHVADSLQLVDLAPPETHRWVDLGSGGGFPGLVVAAALAERPEAQIHLVESDTRKAAFLREAARIAELPAQIHAERIEAVAKSLAEGTQIVSARALAPLPKLLTLAHPFLAAGATGLFPKGKDVESELTEAAKGWTLDIERHESRSDPSGRILVVRRAEPRRGG